MASTLPDFSNRSPVSGGVAPHKFIDEYGNPVEATLHDADTMYTPDGTGIRFGGGVNAAETTKLTDTGGFSAGSSLGNAQTQAVESLISDYKYLPDFTSGAYKRKVANPTKATGETLSRDLIAHDIVQPTGYTPNSDIEARSLERFSTMMNPDAPKTKLDVARDLVAETLSAGRVIPRLQADTIEQYQDYTTATSFKGLAAQEANIKDLEKRLLSPKINDQQRETVRATLEKLKENYQRNLNAPQNIYTGSVEGTNKQGGYGVMGEWDRALDQGLLAVKENAANMLDYFGDATNDKQVVQTAKFVKGEVAREQREVDLKAGDVDPTGGTITTVDDVIAEPTKAFRFIGTTLLSQGPLMATMVAGSVAGGIVGGIPGSVIAPVAIGIGDVYGEMPDDEKNVLAAGAIGSAIGLVDRLGLAKGSIKALDLIKKDSAEKVIAKVATLKGISIPSARDLVNVELKSIGKEYATLVHATAVNQLVAKKGLRDLITQITLHAGQEAATEAVQEAMQVLGIASVTSVDVDYEKLLTRVRDSAVAGGILGGALNTYSSLQERSLFNQELNLLSGIETNKRSDNSLIADEERKRNGKMLSDIELANRLSVANVPMSYDSTGKSKGLDELVAGGKPSLASDAATLLTEGGLLSQSRDNALRNFIGFQGGREIAGLLDANLVRGVYSGLSAFKRIHMIANTVMSKLPTLAQKATLFGTTDGKEIGTKLLRASRGGAANKATRDYMDLLDKMGYELAQEVMALSPVTSGWSPVDIIQPNFFIDNQVVDPVLVRQNEREFIDTMMKHWNTNGTPGVTSDPTYFTELTSRIKDNMTHREIRELKDLGVLSNPVFDKFKSKDVEANTVKMVGAISRGAVRSAMFGDKGEILAKGIYKMLEAGEISKEQAASLAVDIKQQLDMFDGKLNKIKNPLARGIQENMVFMSMMSYMDTSLFANLGEVVYGGLGLNPSQIATYFGRTAKIFAKDVFAKLTQVGSKISKGAIKSVDEVDISEELKLLGQTGHYGHMNDIAFNIGANISTQSKRNMSTIMFKANLVESATNAARAARASFAADEFNSLVSIIAESPVQNNLTRWARDRLQYYRVDPDEMVKLYLDLGSIDKETLEDPSKNQAFVAKAKELIRIGTVNFVDEFSSRPEPGSSAKLLEDHRFSLFTQFKRFTYHFSSNVVPQLWKMYVKRGDVKYTYSAFNLAMVAFAVSYAGMAMKAALRGEDDQDEEKVFLKRMQQAFNYSWGQAPGDMYNMAATVAGTKTGNASVPESIATTATKLSPAMGLASSIFKDTYKISTGKDVSDKAKTDLIKKVPVLGEFPIARTYFEKDK